MAKAGRQTVQVRAYATRIVIRLASLIHDGSVAGYSARALPLAA
jgi:hypothetical protein